MPRIGSPFRLALASGFPASTIDTAGDTGTGAERPAAAPEGGGGPGLSAVPATRALGTGRPLAIRRDIVGPVAVVGLGTFGATIATDLASFGHHVIGIDLDERRVSDLAEDLAQAVIADSRDERALRDAGVDQCDAVVIAMGSDLEASLLTAVNARALGVRQIWAKSRARTQRQILSAIGVDHIVNPERDMAHRVAQTIHNPFVTDYMIAADGMSVVSLDTPEQLVGRELKAVRFEEKYSIACLGLLRDGILHRFHADPVIETGDVLLLLGRRADLQRFGEAQCV